MSDSMNELSSDDFDKKTIEICKILNGISVRDSILILHSTTKKLEKNSIVNFVE